jgi:hypothetical protein
VIGDELFPTYELKIREGDPDVEEELWTHHEAAHADITVRVEADFTSQLFAYDAQGTFITRNEGPLELVLEPGDNLLGFMVATPIDGKPEWVGFEWVTIIYEGEEENEYVTWEFSGTRVE